MNLNNFPSISIVGATGAVGKICLDILKEKKYPSNKINLLASKRSEGKSIQYFDDFKMFTYDGTNYVEKTPAGEPGKHYYDEFDKNIDDSNYLPRTDYCHNMSDPLTSVTATGGIDVTNAQALSWNYVDSVNHNGVDYDHQINRSATDAFGNDISLPGINWGGLTPWIGPLAPGSSACEGLKFLLGN